jgi:flagellar basal body-associated protein FliL
MKKITILFLLCFSSFCGCSSCGKKEEAGGITAYHQFPLIHTPLTSDPHKEIFLGVTAVYYEKESLKLEFTSREDSITQVISLFASTMTERDLKDSGRYEKSRTDLRDKINGELHNGRIENVLFRTISIQ